MRTFSPAHPIALLLTAIIFFFVENKANPQALLAKKTDQPITIDGQMDESVWQEAEVTTQFQQYFPFDTSQAVMKTQVRVAYDDKNLYIIAKMMNPGPRDKYIIPSYRRDFAGRAFDIFSVVLDTYQDRTNAFNFGMNPYGGRREALISNGGAFSGGGGGLGAGGSFDLSWDNKWYGAAKIYDDYWMAEMAIPFKTLRYKKGLDKWYVNFYRIDSQDGEMSTWSPIPRNFSIINLAFNNELNFEQPLKSPGTNISVIPYTTYKLAKDFEDGTPTKSEPDIGGDAKIALSSSMNLDLTVNPDFSQVEVDQQVTDLDRFEIFFPERRQFFLENADLFSSYGNFSSRPFFSRRIGITRDTTTGTNIQNRLLFGARMSGKISNSWRLGLMTIQAASNKDIGLPSINYTVASVQRKLWERSNISMIMVNKQAVQDEPGGSFTLSPADYNRTLGVDFNLASADSKWTGKAYYHQSWDQDKLDSAFSTGLEVRMSTYKWDIRTAVRTIGANFNPEVGFVRRTNFLQNNGTFSYQLYPSQGSIQKHGPGFDYDFLGNQNHGVTDWDMNLLYNITFRNTASFSIRLRRQFTYLLDSFDASGTGNTELPAFTEYFYNLIIARFNSDQRKSFFFELSTRSGQYFNGTRINLQGSATYRFQPYGSISMDFQYNRIRMPQPYDDANLYLVGPRLDVTFSTKLYWTTFIQYNNQINNLNINTRLQWRYAPVSDLFLVYTDNYYAGVNGNFVDFSSPKSRSFVVKLTYWLNL